MTYLTPAEANAWLEPTKLTLTAIEAELDTQISVQILNRLSPVFNISTWVNNASTPRLVRSIMAMYYVAWVYDRTYADDGESNDYAKLLRSTADANISGLLSGSIILPEDPSANTDNSAPSFFPNDASSALEPTVEEPSNGPPAFMMGTVF